MCMDVQSNEMGDRSLDDDVQIVRCRIEKRTNDKVSVKQERPDEAEIRELAAKMVEANKAKMLTAIPGVSQRPAGATQSCTMLGYLTGKKTNDTTLTLKTSTVDGKVPLDDESQRGKFGWITFDKSFIPFIYRGSEKYCAVRILEAKLLNKYLTFLHPDIYSCTCIKSYFITEAESKLFNEINIKHCENQFGKEQFTTKDLVVRLSDAKEFYAFLDVCYTKLTSQNVATGQKSEKCGFIRINKESVVPYTVKDNLKYVPLFYFEGETDNLKLKAEKLEGWDLSYLKFCCKVQGIRNELFSSETCSVISLSDIKSYFPPGTGFEDYWPSKVTDSQLFVSGKSGASAGGWTKQPPAPPPSSSSKLATVHNNNNNNINSNNNKNSLNTRTSTLQNMVTRNSANNSNMCQVNQSRSSATTHQSHPSPTGVSSNVRSSNNSQQMNHSVSAGLNGWSGLVGGQAAFQANAALALAPQSNSIIRMPTNSSLNMHNQMTTSKGYAQQQQQQQQQQSRSSRSGSSNSQQYPSYPVTTMQGSAQPPPLVRPSSHSNQSNLGYPTYGKDDWGGSAYATSNLSLQNVTNASTYPQMLNLSNEQVHALLHPQSSASALMSHNQRHTPPAHSTSHPKYPPPLIPVANGSSNNSGHLPRRKALIPISEPNPSSSTIAPYNVQKALVAEKFVPCINFKPYIYSELLMTLPDFVQNFFPDHNVESCRHVMTEVLGVDLYRGNRYQMKKLLEAEKCSSINDDLPLVQVSNLLKYMPQMKYMLRSMPTPAHSPEEHSAKKRQRTS